MAGDVGHREPQELACIRENRQVPREDQPAQRLRLEPRGDVDERRGVEAQRVQDALWDRVGGGEAREVAVARLQEGVGGRD